MRESRCMPLCGRDKVVASADFIIQKLAREICETRGWQKLPTLAVFLEEAGCTQEALLQHFRGWQQCVGCKGTGRRDTMVDAGYNNPLMLREGWTHCWLCNVCGQGEKPGWVRVQHVDRCFVCEAIGGINEWLPQTAAGSDD